MNWNPAVCASPPSVVTPLAVRRFSVDPPRSTIAPRPPPPTPKGGEGGISRGEVFA